MKTTHVLTDSSFKAHSKASQVTRSRSITETGLMGSKWASAAGTEEVS